MSDVNKINIDGTEHNLKDADAIETLSFTNGSLTATKGDGTTQTVAFPAFYSFSVSDGCLTVSEVTNNA